MADDERFDRKELFKGGVAYAKKLLAAVLEERLDVIPRTSLRPPGAILESLFLTTCDGCGRCVESCPVRAIRLAGGPSGRAEVTPVITPTLAPCRVCESVPCSRVCPSGALVPVKRSAIAIGTAIIQGWCLASTGTECDICVAGCPVGEDALTRARGGLPRVLDACVGCGTCTHLCPTRPRAIRIKPL